MCLGLRMAEGEERQCLGRGSGLEHGKGCVSCIVWLRKLDGLVHYGDEFSGLVCLVNKGGDL